VTTSIFLLILRRGGGEGVNIRNKKKKKKKKKNQEQLNFFEDTPGNIAAPPSMPEIFYFDKFAEEEDNMFLNNDYNKEILEKRRKR